MFIYVCATLIVSYIQLEKRINSSNKKRYDEPLEEVSVQDRVVSLCTFFNPEKGEISIENLCACRFEGKPIRNQILSGVSNSYDDLELSWLLLLLKLNTF